MSRDQQISYVIGRFLLLPINEMNRNDLKGPRLSIRYWRISFTFGSGIACLTLAGKSKDPKNMITPFFL